MEPIKETIRSLFQEMILPGLKDIKDTLIRHEERLNSVDRRIGGINTHLIDQSSRIDETNKSLNGRTDPLYDVIVRRDEHTKLDERVTRLERDVEKLKAKIAA